MRRATEMHNLQVSIGTGIPSVEEATIANIAALHESLNVVTN